VKTSEILEHALKRFDSDNTHSGICAYIGGVIVRRDSEENPDYIEKLRVNKRNVIKRIQESLEDYAFVSSWLVGQGIDESLVTAKAVREYRKLWLKELIREYKLKGD